MFRGFESHYGYLMGHGDYFDHTTQCSVRSGSVVLIYRGSYISAPLVADIEDLI